MSINSDSIQAPPVPAAPKPNTFSRIAGVLTSPISTFEDIARRPNVLGPLGVLMALTILFTVLIVPRVDFAATYREAFDGMNMPADRMEKSIRMAAAVGKATAYFGPLLQILAFAVIAGVLLIAFRMFGGEGDYKQAFSTTLYSWFPICIKSILASIVLMTRKVISLNDMANPLRSNLAFTVDMKSQPILFSLLGSLDIFTIWTIVLMVIGFAALSRFSKVKSAVIIVSIWLVVVLFKVGGAAMGAARMKH
jgi:hypothetical protein